MRTDFENILRNDVSTAREAKRAGQYRGDNSGEAGKGAFPYQLKANLHGLLTFTPIFKHKKKSSTVYNPLERKIQDPVLPTTVARDENGHRIFIESFQGKSGKFQLQGARLAQYLKKVKYDRKNKISVRGTCLKSRAINTIKNSILHKYYSTGGDYSGDMKFFTYTIQDTRYFELLSNFQRNRATIEFERNRDITTEYHPFAPLKALDAWEKSNIHPDQYFIRKFSDHLENLRKRDKQNIESYVWVAEKTEQGVLHFHAIFETKFLSAKAESTAWASRCKFDNHFNSVEYGMHRTKSEIKNGWTGNLNPGAISAYLTKYISKNQSEIFGRNYGMSRAFYQHSVKGIQKLVNPHFFLKVPPNEETKTKGYGYIICESPWTKIDYETGEIIKQQIHLPVTIIKQGSIDLPSGSLPTYCFSSPRKKLIKQLFPALYSKCEFLLQEPVKQLELCYK